MTIYLVKEHSGEWEDYHEYTRYCTSNKIKAKNKKAELEQQYELDVKQSEKCMHCNIDECTQKNYDKMSKEIKNYCSMFDAEYDSTDDHYYCKNYYHLWDESTFEIVEMECEE